MELSTVTIDPLRVACLRHVGPFSTIEESWTKFHDVLRAQGVSQPAPEFLSVYHWHDEGTPPAQHQSDCALVIPESFHPSEPLVLSEVPGGKYLTAVYTGPYEGIGRFWEEFERAAAEQGHTLADTACFEIYLNDPNETPPEQLRTQMYLPIQQ